MLYEVITIAVMRRVVEADPKHAEALNFLAYTFAEQGENLDEALTLARRALELNPEGVITSYSIHYTKLYEYWRQLPLALYPPVSHLPFRRVYFP